MVEKLVLDSSSPAPPLIWRFLKKQAGDQKAIPTPKTKIQYFTLFLSAEKHNHLSFDLSYKVKNILILVAHTRCRQH